MDVEVQAGSSQFNMEMNKPVICPICSEEVSGTFINEHIDSGCTKQTVSSQRSQDSTHSELLSLPEKNGQTLLTPLSRSVVQRGTKRTNPDSYSPLQSTLTMRPRARYKQKNVLGAMPLAEALRPTTLSNFVGQRHITNPDSWLVTAISNREPFGSLILWGPPGCGKTTLARLLATASGYLFKEVCAALVGMNEVKAILEEAKSALTLSAKKTVLFIDEVHRFNKGQQDILLPYVERGLIQFIGASTENPSFRLTGALLSRCRLHVLEPLTDDDIKTILLNAVHRVANSLIEGPEVSSTFPQLTPKVLSTITTLATGDARMAISLLDHVLKSPSQSSETSLLSSLKQSASTSYNRQGEDHYDMISALHKSVRGSHGSAAMYWLARMLVAGEDPLYIARRMVVCASEDIGLADPHALPIAMAALQACQVIGMPECRINLAHVVAYLSEASKCTRSYESYKRAEAAVKLNPKIPVPLSMRNAPTKMMEELGYGRSYCYNPDYVHPVHNNYLPTNLEQEEFLKKTGDIEGKLWDECELSRWEELSNGGENWEGRQRT